MSSIIKVNTVQDTDGNNIINENADTITVGAAGDTVDVPGTEVKTNKISPTSGTGLQLGDSGDTITIPSGATLANAGTATGFSAIDWQSTIVTGATHTASANQGIWINTTSNACTLTLPGSPSVGDQVIFSDFARTWGSNAVTVSLNGSKYQGYASPSPIYNTQGETVHIVYSGSTGGWIPINDGATADEMPQAYSVDFLVIAGGGGGNTGGAGAGGYRNSYSSETSGGGGSSETALSLAPGTQYTITVGAGGAGVESDETANDGVASSIAGSGITTISSVGGGGSGRTDGGGLRDGRDGGSGGGGAGDGNGANGGSGTANQGYDGGDSQSGNPYPGGGGGGAGAVGGTSSGGNSGAGGTGVASSITGSSVTRAGGGGGGGAVNGANSASGGSGGGGNGAPNNSNGGNATANTGSGGGGLKPYLQGYHGGNGGSGVVILRMATSNYSGTTTGSPSVSTSGSDTIITFNGDGSYTA